METFKIAKNKLAIMLRTPSLESIPAIAKFPANFRTELNKSTKSLFEDIIYHEAEYNSLDIEYDEQLGGLIGCINNSNDNSYGTNAKYIRQFDLLYSLFDKYKIILYDRKQICQNILNRMPAVDLKLNLNIKTDKLSIFALVNPYIKSLNVTTGSRFLDIEGCKQLENLSVENSPKLLYIAMKDLFKLRTAKFEELSKIDEIDLSMIKAINNIIINKCGNCKELKLGKASQLNALSSIRIDTIKIKRLILNGGDQLCKLILYNCPDLNILKLGDFTGLKNIILFNIPKIGKLDLSRAREIREISIGQCKNFNELKLGDANQLKALQGVNIKDTEIKQLILSGANNLRNLTICNCPDLSLLGLKGMNALEQLMLNNIGITTFGKGYFPNLTVLQIFGCKKMKKVILSGSKFSKLNSLSIENNRIDLACIVNFDHFITLNIKDNYINDFKVIKCDQLKTLSIFRNDLDNLRVINCNELTEITIREDHANILQMVDCNHLKRLNAFQNSLDILEVINCGIELDPINEQRLIMLRAYDNHINTLAVKKWNTLQKLDAHNNNIKQFIHSSLDRLETLILSDNDLSQYTDNMLKFNAYKQLTTLLMSNTQAAQLICTNGVLHTLEINKNPKMHALNVSGNQLKALDCDGDEGLRFLNASNNQLTSVKLPLIGKELEFVNLRNNQLAQSPTYNGVLNLGFRPSLRNVYLKRNPSINKVISWDYEIVKKLLHDKHLEVDSEVMVEYLHSFHLDDNKRQQFDNLVNKILNDQNSPWNLQKFVMDDEEVIKAHTVLNDILLNYNADHSSVSLEQITEARKDFIQKQLNAIVRIMNDLQVYQNVDNDDSMKKGILKNNNNTLNKYNGVNSYLSREYLKSQNILLCDVDNCYDEDWMNGLQEWHLKQAVAQQAMVRLCEQQAYLEEILNLDKVSLQILERLPEQQACLESALLLDPEVLLSDIEERAQRICTLEQETILRLTGQCEPIEQTLLTNVAPATQPTNTSVENRYPHSILIKGSEI